MPPEATQLLDAIDQAIANLQAAGKPMPAGVDPGVAKNLRTQHAKAGATPFDWKSFMTTLLPILLALLGGS